MDNFVLFIKDTIATYVRNEAANLQGALAECRFAFNGPPLPFLRPLLELFQKEGGIAVTLKDGEQRLLPIVLCVETLGPNEKNPLIGQSGICDNQHFMTLRNSPHEKIWVGLLPPGSHSSISQTSTRTDFGMLAQNNAGVSKTAEWWQDPFIQLLADGALARFNWNEALKDEAKELVRHAVYSAAEVDQSDSARIHAWHVLSRIWSIPSETANPELLTSLACGFCPCDGGMLDATAQHQILKNLAKKFLGGIHYAIENAKNRAADEDERCALDSVAAHIESKCDVITALERSAPYFYGPFSDERIGEPPDWWELLTVERWTHLLEENTQRKEAIEITCENRITSQVTGILPVVAKSAKLRLTIPPSFKGTVPILLTREGGGASNRKEWLLEVNGFAEIVDSDFPQHSSPFRYTAQLPAPTVSIPLKSSTLRLICLDQWVPAISVSTRTAHKTSFFKKAKSSTHDFEATIELKSEGRHYIDLYARADVGLPTEAYSADENGVLNRDSPATIHDLEGSQYGFEVEVHGDCFYEITLDPVDLATPKSKGKVLRIFFSAEDGGTSSCGSEFERLITLNRQIDGSKNVNEVLVDRRLRCCDLQSWALAQEDIANSFYPLVFGQDYAAAWSPRDWRSREDTIFSGGKFLNDPRPPHHEMVPPESFLNARQKLATAIRDKDGTGLVEEIRLGELVYADPDFSETVEAYVRSYFDWLDVAPDAATWCDVIIVNAFESDGETLAQEPYAVLISPLHPIRLAWHCLAQKVLFLAQRKQACPAGSILDPDCVPDSILLPLRTANGGLKRIPFFSVECSSDYWSILWNSEKLGELGKLASGPPFDREFGILIGGISSGFSISQVNRSMDDVRELLVAKPTLNVLLESAGGQNNACNLGLIEWCLEHFGEGHRDSADLDSAGRRLVQIIDARDASARPDDVEISNLAEDTGNAVRWFERFNGQITPDLAIIAQLETRGQQRAESKLSTPLGFGGLIRQRIRHQLPGNQGVYLAESRTAASTAPTGDGLADKTSAAIVRLENAGDSRSEYVFAPSVSTIDGAFKKNAQYVAISSSAVDPACFLGGWLKDVFLWDYDLPSYSNRAGDSNGYYLLSGIKPADQDSLRQVISRLPDCKDLPDDELSALMLEVARRGIPTVRGLSGGNLGASGDLGLFLAARLLQDAFSSDHNTKSLLDVWTEEDQVAKIALVVPVDPFKSHLEDLTKAIKKGSNKRPDLMVIALRITDSTVAAKLTPVEVKYRSGAGSMVNTSAREALSQAESLAKLLEKLNDRADEPEMILWKLAFQHLLVSVVSFGMRVYSQQPSVLKMSNRWAEHHGRIVEAILSGSLSLEVDKTGRLIVIDGSPISQPQDNDQDSFRETIVITHKDASKIVRKEGQEFYRAISATVGDWRLFPADTAQVVLPAPTNTEPATAQENPVDAGIVESTPARLPADAPVVVTESNDVEIAQPALGMTDSIAAPAEPSATAPQPTNNTGVTIHLGKTLDGFQTEPREICISDTRLNHLNIGVVGDLGTGKTQLLKSLVYQISQGTEQNRGIKPRVLIFDYKKDYSSDDFVKATGARVVRPQHLPLNLFDTSASADALAPWLGRFKFFSDVLDKIFSNVGPVQRAKLKNAVRKAYEDRADTGVQPTIYDIHTNYQAILGNGADSISSIIDDIVDMGLFTPIPSNAQSFEQFFDGVVVIALNELGQDDRTKNMIVAIMLNMFYESMLRIPKRPYEGVNPSLRVIDSFLLVDEADSIMKYEFDVLRKILLQGREFGVGVILASQYLSHFKAGASDYREPLLTWLIHKVPNITAQELGALGLTGDVAQQAGRVKSLNLHECLFKTANVGGEFLAGTPFYKLLPP